jgi:RNA polymerase-binding transcription factor
MTEQAPGPALSPAEQATLRELLAEDRDGTTARIAALTHDWQSLVDASVSANTDDEHDPEGATIAFERAQIEALLAQAREHVDDLDQALQRLADGSYGRCERCGQAIAAERLAARPVATTCITCAAAGRR